MKCKLVFDSGLFVQLIENSIEEFKRMESESIFDVDIEKCISDYASYLYICHSYLTKVIVL